MKKINNFFKIFLPLIVGGIIGIIIKDQIDYKFLIKPHLAPPKILFPIAWSIIYLLMGLSYYLLNKGEEINKYYKIIYYFQLIINALWSIIFFVFKLHFLSCIWIVLLDLLVLLMLIVFYKKNKVSTFLNIPYFLWILFATYLTIGITILN